MFFNVCTKKVDFVSKDDILMEKRYRLKHERSTKRETGREELYLREWFALKDKEFDERTWLKEKMFIQKMGLVQKKTSLTRKGRVELSKQSLF